MLNRHKPNSNARINSHSAAERKAYTGYRLDLRPRPACVALVGAAVVAIAPGCTRRQAPLVADATQFGRVVAPAGESPGAIFKDLLEPPRGPFGLSLLATADGAPVDLRAFQQSSACGECHERQWEELDGSFHSASHLDPLYRRTAELALREAGPEIYASCSACHAPHGVAAGLIPNTPEEKLPAIAKAGLLCDVCHQISDLNGERGPWQEPGNASFVFSPDTDRKFGPPSGDDNAAEHAVETRAFFGKSEYCASCHTIVHPYNGLRLEHTYAEWKASAYADAGIQCQDCHMRSVEEAAVVARTMKPVPLTGRSAPDGDERPIARHWFVGGNSNAGELTGSPEHGAMARARLQSAAALAIVAPESGQRGGTLSFDVVVHNVAAGHSLPTSLTEMREMWVELSVRSAKGDAIFLSGGLEQNGDIERDAMRFGAIAGDKEGRVTYKPWEVAQFLFKRLVPPKGSERDTFRILVPSDAGSHLEIDARLLYRSAPPKVVAMLFEGQGPALETVEMTRTSVRVALGH